MTCCALLQRTFFTGISSITLDQSGLPVLKQPAAKNQGPWLQLQGRALDQKAAYKQLARHPKDA